MENLILIIFTLAIKSLAIAEATEDANAVQAPEAPLGRGLLSDVFGYRV